MALMDFCTVRFGVEMRKYISTCIYYIFIICIGTAQRFKSGGAIHGFAMPPAPLVAGPCRYILYIYIYIHIYYIYIHIYYIYTYLLYIYIFIIYIHIYYIVLLLATSDGNPVSPFHDIPLHANDQVKKYLPINISTSLHVCAFFLSEFYL